MNNTESVTGVTLPMDHIIDTTWAKEQLSRVDIFSQELLNYGRGEIFFMLKSNLSDAGFEQSLQELSFTLDTASTYINYLQKRPVLEAIKAKYYIALSLSAAEYIPECIEEALALCDVCIAKYGKFTADNLRKAAEDTGTPIKKMSDAALTVEALKKKALHEWLLSEHSMSDDDILQASRIQTEGKGEYLEKMLQAFALLGDWKVFYDIIAEPVHKSNDIKAMRFLSDMQDSSGSIEEYLASEQAYMKLTRLKETFANEVYPELQFSQESK